MDKKLHAFPDGRVAWSITDLCKATGISRSQYYELESIGLGPRKFYPGRRPMFTADAVAEWLTTLEARGDQVPATLKSVREERRATAA